jgi:hypothetical protein
VTVVFTGEDAAPIVQLFRTGPISIYLARADVPASVLTLNGVVNAVGGGQTASFNVDSAFAAAREEPYGDGYSDNMRFWRIYVNWYNATAPNAYVGQQYVFARNNRGMRTDMFISEGTIPDGDYRFKAFLRNPDDIEGTRSDLSTFTLTVPDPYLLCNFCGTETPMTGETYMRLTRGRATVGGPSESDVRIVARRRWGDDFAGCNVCNH